jgi:hypothetical protein
MSAKLSPPPFQNAVDENGSKLSSLWNAWISALYSYVQTANSIITESAAVISANYSINSGNNGASVSPVTIASGMTVTVPTGSIWLILV